MTQPRLIAQFQPLAAEGRGGMERVWHQGTPVPIDATPHLLGLDADGVRALHAEADKSHGKDLDHLVDAIPGFVEANTGEGGFDVLLDGDDVETFLDAHGLGVATLTDDDLGGLREAYGIEPGAQPFVVGEEPATPKGP